MALAEDDSGKYQQDPLSFIRRQHDYVDLPPPATLEEAGLSQSLIEELLLKGMYYLGRPTAQDLAQGLMMPFAILKQVLAGLKAENLCEVVGSQGFGEQLYEYILTDSGRGKVIEVLSRSQYYGPAPVPYAHYLEMTLKQCREQPVIDRTTLLQGLEHLVVNERMIRALGPALNSGEPILFHGPSGNGKTSLALALGNVLAGQDPIWIPHVIIVAGQLVKIFDPTVHVPIKIEPSEETSELLPGLSLGNSYDRRWVLIKRPLVVGGGEITMDRFELTQEPATNVYFAPHQWKANGGTLLIDDLGRQSMRPQDLLNRWIIPLEKHKDYLTLKTGQTLEVPLNILIIFATNLHPNDLMDEAYLRRLRYRIPAPNPSAEQYRRIFRAVCGSVGLAYDPESVDYLFHTWYEGQGIDMRACHPRDLIAHIMDICRFERIEPTLSPDLMDQAAELNFAGHLELKPRAGVLRED